jgi:ribosomal protein S18 acetylase RimI-like enzyme
VSSAASAEFREASARDLPVLLRMMRGLAEHPPAIAFDEGEVGAALEKFFADAALGKAWLIWVGERAAGYVILTLGYSFEFRGRDAFIDELYVAPEFRRQGLGRRAMEFAEARAREMGVNAVHLEVDRGNGAAQELYRRAGYDEHGRFLMTKWLRTER